MPMADAMSSRLPQPNPNNPYTDVRLFLHPSSAPQPEYYFSILINKTLYRGSVLFMMDCG